MIFSALGGWFIAYLFPVLLVFGVIVFFSRRPGTAFRMIVVHSGLCLSIMLSQFLLYFAYRPFPWNFYIPSIIFFMAATVVVFALLGRFGLLYALSAFIQQLTLVSIAYYLSDVFGFWQIVLLVIPIYSVSHLLQLKHWYVRIPATLLWGMVSLALFALRGDIFLNASLHATLGSILIYGGVLYPRSDFAIKRVQDSLSK